MSLFQVDIASGPFKAALQKLNDCLQPENLDAILKIQQRQRMENDEIKEEDILVGIGIHIIAKLSGKAVASREKSLHKCPCGCNKNLQVGDKMYIGNHEPHREKTCLQGFRPGLTQTELFSHKRQLEA